tara:strand:+ start:141 stop:2357 length:2217 start_codon:yes stop_codon:yes gene_type:complete
MQSHILIDNLRKSLYTRLYYALVDSDYLIKALSEDEIKTMIDEVEKRKKRVMEIIQFGNTRDKRFDWGNKTYNKKIDAIEAKYPLDRSKSYNTYENDLRQKESEIKNVNTILSTQLADRYPEGEMESNLIFEYLEKNHGAENLNDVVEQVKEYREKLFDSRMEETRRLNEERRPQREAEQKRRQEISRVASEKYKKYLQREEVKRQKERKERPESQKLVEEWMKSAAGKDAERYSNLINLINLVGSLYTANDKTILRLEKYLNDSDIKIPNTDRTKLKEILLQLQSEQKQKQKRQGRSTKITPDATQAKTEGIKVGQQSKILKKSLSVRFGGDERLKIKGTDYFIGFEKLDLRNPTWFNSVILRDIPMYWVGKAGFKGDVDKWEKLSEDKKTEFIKKVAGQLPEYPKLKPLGTLESLYRNVWERNYALGKPEDPENFAYFAQGLRDGIMQSKGDTVANDFLRLQTFQQDTLPKLVRAIKSNIVVDTETNTIDFRLGPAFGKLMRKYRTMEERTEVIEDLIDIVRGRSLSEKYAGRNAQELKAIEKSIIDTVSEKIEGETVLSYIISTFMQMYPSSKILAKLLKDEDALVEVEYLKPAKVQSIAPSTPRKLPTYQRETKKSLDNLLVVLGEEDNIIIKEDVGLILESLNAKQRKKVKAILNIADPTEYFGHDFLKLSELVRVLKSLGVVKGDKKLNKKVLKLEDENLKVVKLATRLRKDYEKLYKQLREMVYPKLGEEK